jgi:hypothetical protein
VGTIFFSVIKQQSMIVSLFNNKYLFDFFRFSNQTKFEILSSFLDKQKLTKYSKKIKGVQIFNQIKNLNTFSFLIE